MKENDSLIRFLFEEHGVRGEWVHLSHSLQQAKQHQTLVNEAVDSQLGQALAAVALLSAIIKFNGSMIMQMQSAGELKALVAQCSHDRKIRGLVRSEAEVNATNLKDMLGSTGRLVLTIEQENADPYQGIVGIEADNLAGILTAYFQQSEQLNTRLWLFANQTDAVGLFIQELPSTDQEEKDKEDWQRLQILADTVTEEEMLTLDCHTLLHRLFNQEAVRIYPAESVEFQCGCGRKKIAGTLLALGESELRSILQERDAIEVDCQFCGESYLFDKVDVENLLKNPLSDNDSISTVRH